jgi:hypothetical protein
MRFLRSEKASCWDKVLSTSLSFHPSVCVGQCQLLNPLSDFYKIRYGSYLQSAVEWTRVSWKSAQWQSYIPWREYTNFCPCFIYISIWVKFAIRDLHILQFSIYDFRENRRREGHTFVVAILWNNLKNTFVISVCYVTESAIAYVVYILLYVFR